MRIWFVELQKRFGDFLMRRNIIQTYIWYCENPWIVSYYF